jgi:hypothetical protein
MMWGGMRVIQANFQAAQLRAKNGEKIERKYCPSECGINYSGRLGGNKKISALLGMFSDLG